MTNQSLPFWMFGVDNIPADILRIEKAIRGIRNEVDRRAEAYTEEDYTADEWSSIGDVFNDEFAMADSQVEAGCAAMTVLITATIRSWLIGIWNHTRERTEARLETDKELFEKFKVRGIDLNLLPESAWSQACSNLSNSFKHKGGQAIKTFDLPDGTAYMKGDYIKYATLPFAEIAKEARMFVLAAYEAAVSRPGYVPPRAPYYGQCRCCLKGLAFEKPRVCPDCGHEFKGEGWEGIDAHWRSLHEGVMSYERFWDTLCTKHRTD